MLDRNSLKLSKYLPYSAMMAGVLSSALTVHGAHAQTADDVLTQMGEDERFAYLSGVVEGLATARWVADKPDSTGMKCIYDWYFGQNAETHQAVFTWLERNREQRVGILMQVLIGKECPKD